MAIKTRQSKEELFQKADNGNADAMYSIGYRYLKGIGGLPKDQNKAVEWFTKSAQAGSSNAVAMIKKLPPEQPMSSSATSETPYTPSYSYAPTDYGESSTSTSMFLIMLFMLMLAVIGGTFWINAKWKKEKEEIANKKKQKESAEKEIEKEKEKEKALKKKQAEQEIKNLEIEAINEQIRAINSYIVSTIKSHIETLSLKRKQMVRVDDYGNVFDDKWQREIDYFIDKVLKNDQTLKDLLDFREQLDGNADLLENYKKERGAIAYSAWVKHPTRSDIQGMIIRAVAIHDDLRRQNGAEHSGNIDIEPLSPIEFEHFCADILEANGWQARVTQASGDQGIDVIAEYGGKKAVFQCKKYTSPVGNKAVQEAIAGKQFAGASIAAVVSNATYTPSAKQLANTTDVYLLHYSELAQFKERIGIDSNAL
ncbi:MAG: restriction endonuclease [Methylovulum miyakonense]|uniref:restriction endonuclease n=1 Tax=Methylovulum miyakonense TaxID=645578 RepID=UPI003BB4D658